MPHHVWQFMSVIIELLDCRFAQGSEAGAVHQLLDEVLSTALERALEPQLLEGMVLERIMGAREGRA